jgi:hypothetical protein
MAGPQFKPVANPHMRTDDPFSASSTTSGSAPPDHHHASSDALILFRHSGNSIADGFYQTKATAEVVMDLNPGLRFAFALFLLYCMVRVYYKIRDLYNNKIDDE